MESEATLVPKFVEFTQKMVQSLFNYTASYAVESNEMKPSETVRLYLVPITKCVLLFPHWIRHRISNFVLRSF